MTSTRVEDLEAQVASLERRLMTWVAARGTVWVVHYQSNYPREVDSAWLTEELAKARASELGDGWEWERWVVGEKASEEGGT